MKNQSVEGRIRLWWLSLIVGILFLIFGAGMMVYPVETYAALVTFFAIFMLISGVVEIIFALSNTRFRGWGWTITAGLIDLMLGAYLLVNPSLAALVIPFIISLWLMFRGFSAIGVAMNLKPLGIGGMGWYILLGILAVICSLIILWHPTTGMALAVVMTSVTFMLIGIHRIALSLAMRKIGKNKSA